MKNETCFSSESVFMVCENVSALHSLYAKSMPKAMQGIMIVPFRNTISAVCTSSYKVKDNEKNSIKKCIIKPVLP